MTRKVSTSFTIEEDLLKMIKKEANKKITFGDFSASEYLFSNKTPYINLINNWTTSCNMNRNEFIKIFSKLIRLISIQCFLKSTYLKYYKMFLLFTFIR